MSYQLKICPKCNAENLTSTKKCLVCKTSLSQIDPLTFGNIRQRKLWLNPLERLGQKGITGLAALGAKVASRVNYIKKPVILSVLGVMAILGVVTITYAWPSALQLEPAAQNAPLVTTAASASTPQTTLTHSPQVQKNSNITPQTRIKPFTEGACVTTVIPYKTVYVSDPNKYAGTTFEDKIFYDGSITHCSPDSNGLRLWDRVSPALDKTVYIGTKPRPQPAGPSISYQQAQMNCNAKLGSAADSSAMIPCMAAYGWSYTY